MNKQRLVLYALLPLLFAGCFSVPTPVSADSSDKAAFDAMVNGIPFTQWAMIRISSTALFKFDGYTLNLGKGSEVYVPSGRHSLEVGFAEWEDRATLECTIVPGKIYHLVMTDYDYEINQSRYVMETRATASFTLSDQGFTEFAVPAAGQSIIRFNLKGYYTAVMVDGNEYALDAGERQITNVHFFVSSGNHTISSTAITHELTRDVEPNHFISYTVDTAAAAMTLDFDRPLGLIGKWEIDIDGDGSLVFMLTFTPNGYGWVDAYENGVPNAAVAGSFTYTATDRAVTTTHQQNRSMTMGYAAAQDGNELILNNFWDQGLTVRGKRQ
jgi:uncharacterized protein YndB with AHSA1/START domain